ncbi:MAG: undecaprenyl-phosphate glucose phosphotransferase [Anaerolineae bacterium]|nr:undecaprenyl-phosphate glucose phosphotransferase [Anaerolineae bacterium]MCX8066426.1 undecaprenyl-phosphate glucose phosphotransferase [Anaerolineae bacterium]MDW7992957.1 undecaprenyl-phosphate glucose phosphotransferase [Anaerolineae bacterium]
MSRNGRVPWWVVAVDVLVVTLGFLGGYWLRYDLRWFLDVAYDAPLSAYLPFLVLYVVLTPLFFVVDGVYRTWPRSWMDQVYRITNSTAKVTVLMLAITFVFRPRYYSRVMLIEVGLLTILLLALVRAVEAGLMAYLRKKGVGIRRVVIVGAGEVGRTVMRTIVARPDLGYRVIGFVDDNPEKGYTDIGRFKALGPLENLPRVLEEEKPDEVIITLPWMYHRKIMALVRECERHQARARIVPDIFQMSLTQVNVEDLGGVPLIGVREVSISRGALLVKRVMDVVLAALVLVLAAPLMALIAIAIRLDSPGPVIFRQTRVGLRGRLFEMYKFRSMHVGAEEQQDMLADLNEADGPIFKIRNDPRLTRVGRIIRRFSLDELPQLVNVLRGEMSLVGPRPPIPSEVEKYQEWHKKRLEAPPGMTGLWQVSGRSRLPFDEMVLLDIYYIENWSLWLDFKILMRTIPKVLLGEGAY